MVREVQVELHKLLLKLRAGEHVGKGLIRAKMGGFMDLRCGGGGGALRALTPLHVYQICPEASNEIQDSGDGLCTFSFDLGSCVHLVMQSLHRSRVSLMDSS